MKNIIEKSTDKVVENAEPFIETIKVRLSNPLFASFVISFIALNWKPIVYILFSKVTIEERISFIQTNYYSNFLYNLLYYLVIPLIISLVYTFGIPWVNILVDFLNSKPLKIRRENEHKLINEKYKNEIEYAKNQFQIAVKRSGSVEIETLTNENNRLLDDIEIKNGKIEILNDDLERKTIQINELEVFKTKSSQQCIMLEARNRELETKFLREKYEVYINKIGIRSDEEEVGFLGMINNMFNKNLIHIVNNVQTESGLLLIVETREGANKISSILNEINKIHSFKVHKSEK